MNLGDRCAYGRYSAGKPGPARRCASSSYESEPLYREVGHHFRPRRLRLRPEVLRILVSRADPRFSGAVVELRDTRGRRQGRAAIMVFERAGVVAGPASAFQKTCTAATPSGIRTLICPDPWSVLGYSRNADHDGARGRGRCDARSARARLLPRRRRRELAPSTCSLGCPTPSAPLAANRVLKSRARAERVLAEMRDRALVWRLAAMLVLAAGGFAAVVATRSAHGRTQLWSEVGKGLVALVVAGIPRMRASVPPFGSSITASVPCAGRATKPIGVPPARAEPAPPASTASAAKISDARRSCLRPFTSRACRSRDPGRQAGSSRAASDRSR
jgi:hypothetical protein